MQIAEKTNEGLKRQYEVTIPAKDLESRIDAQITQVSGQIRMPGFRPGKVPKNLVKKMHGEAMHGEALNSAVQEGVQKLVADKQLRPAMQPSVALADDYAQGKDVVFTVELEVLPEITSVNIEGIALEKLVVEPSDAEIEDALKRFADQQKRFDAAPKTYKAQTGDVVVMDFVGTVEGEEFEGGKGEGMQIEIGSGRLIPGFEDQLVGVKANDKVKVEVNFPEDYNVAYLKGKPAVFDVLVTEVRQPQEAAIDDTLATNLGLESLDKLKEILKDQISAELQGMTRTHLKRKLLDHLAANHDFDVPPTMVEAEFGQIWAQLEHEASHEADPAAAVAELENDKDEYRRIAERRVRLGLLLSEIGQKEGVNVTQAEMNRLIGQEAARYPGQQQQVVKYFQENAMAAAQLRAPLYEDKVVDVLLGKAELTERSVSREDLQQAIEDDDETPTGHVHGPGCGHDHHDHDHADGEGKPKKAAKKTAKAADAEPKEDAVKAEKKPAAKKTAAKAEADAEPEKKPAKKAPAKKAAKA
ncbi:trigger factor [uncultured Sphingosinicella sp.]|jgi:trigger factor|uniref:trigger factor n=1 Tax=uncultured Sphingosinicella sp. TaxID=478748 RepID=UPI0030DA59DB|tara:strand:- start:17938 stop:19521 length:1584 start_codon:yes stop_codon:yes gene_type:complete